MAFQPVDLGWNRKFPHPRSCYRLEGSHISSFALSFDKLSESVKHGIGVAGTRAEIA